MLSSDAEITAEDITALLEGKTDLNLNTFDLPTLETSSGLSNEMSSLVTSTTTTETNTMG